MPYEKDGKSEPVCIADEVPFEIPESWEWVHLGEYAEKVTDQVASGSFASLRENVLSLKEPNYAIMVKTADFSKWHDKQILYILTNERYIGDCCYQKTYGSHEDPKENRYSH